MPRTRLVFSLCLLYLFLAISYILIPIRLVAPPPAGDPAAFERELDLRIARVMREARVPGASVALIQRGQVSWAKGYGLADVRTNAPVTPQTLFQASSVSKTATAWGVMKLVENGSLALDAPAESYLTRWHLPPSEFDANEVTIRRLLSHTSGIAANDYVGYLPGGPLPSLEESLANGPPRIVGRMEDFPGTQFVGPTRLVAPPGQEFIYSDSNFVLLQLIVEEVTGEPFAEYMQREVLSPLGLTDSSFARPPELVARTAVPHDAYGEPIPDYVFVELAPAGLYLTASDLARFVASALPGAGGEPAGRGVVSSESVRSMTSPAASIPGLDGWVYADSYGFGYFITTLDNGEYLLSHSGGNLGWACEFSLYPSTGDGIVIMTNGSLGHEVFAEALAAWTDWLGRDQTPVSHAILTARRVFGTLSFSLFFLAALLLARLARDIRSGARRFDPLRPTRTRVIGAALCAVALAAYWMAGHPWMEINVPTQAAGMSWGVDLLCLALFAKILVE
ncbi:MAG: serine hydrolase domain-containing protein [Chloroflexota bacterium]